MIKKLMFVLCLGLLAGSCTQVRQPCLTPGIASFNIVCVHMPTDTSTVAVDTALPAAVFTSLTQTGPIGVIYPQESSFTLSLASVADSCQWLISTDSLKYTPDTLSFYYRRQVTFLSNACGYTCYFHLDSFHTSHHNIDSALILNPSVTNNVNLTHFKIFIHPDY
jgi:Family of unknown function (DUF6452)